MLIHRYDTLTGQYLSSVLADEDPQHPGRWLIPAWSTTDALPERLSGTWPFYRNGAWTLLPDYRGRILYQCDTGGSAEILVAGVSPEEQGLTDQPRPSEEHIWQADSWSLNPAAVARKKHDAAMAEFAQRMEHARRCNAGKADAYAAGLLDDEQIHYFKCWSAYQMALVREIEKETFPENVIWPEEPSPYVPIEPIEHSRPSASPAAVAFIGMDMAAPDGTMGATDMDDEAPAITAKPALTSVNANEAPDAPGAMDTVDATDTTHAGNRRPRRRPARETHAD